MLPIGKLREILSATTVFVCPSVYEPLGIVNLEAMACATAVVASDVGGIPEVIADGQTGLLVHYDPADPAHFELPLAGAVNSLIADPAKARQYGQAGRHRCIQMSRPASAGVQSSPYCSLSAAFGVQRPG